MGLARVGQKPSAIWVKSKSALTLADGRADPLVPYAAAQYQSAVELVCSLVQRYQIPRQYVVRHADIALPPGRKSDPAPVAWNMEAFLNAVYGRDVVPQKLVVIGNGVRVRQGPGVSFPQASDGSKFAALNTGDVVQVDAVTVGEDVDGESHWAHLASGLGFVTMKFCRFA